MVPFPEQVTYIYIYIYIHGIYMCTARTLARVYMVIKEEYKGSKSTPNTPHPNSTNTHYIGACTSHYSRVLAKPKKKQGENHGN